MNFKIAKKNFKENLLSFLTHKKNSSLRKIFIYIIISFFLFLFFENQINKLIKSDIYYYFNFFTIVSLVYPLFLNKENFHNQISKYLGCLLITFMGYFFAIESFYSLTLMLYLFSEDINIFISYYKEKKINKIDK